ncbi:helix-turn-helix DNA binding domain protein [Gordonia Phage Sampson]|uniref:Helix-turn-helix DNA binding domain protein n=2 Tax=Zitchvirus TaxID=2948963 RepID=A0A976UAQ4_9CAUD|nr:helix-turn-helix DNA binding domain protein [Gordonia Phage Sampson]UVF61677.1 helix-turn-helix DNA binding domain protein [Gordonia phage APunk]
MTDKPRLLRQGQAAEYIGVGISTIQRMIASGALPTVQLTPKGWPMIDRHDLDAYIENRKQAKEIAG